MNTKRKLALAGIGIFALAVAVSGSAVIRAADQGEGVPDGFGPALAEELGTSHAEVHRAFDLAVAGKESGGNADVSGAAADELGTERDVVKDAARSLLAKGQGR